MQLFWVQWGAQRHPASMHSPHLSLGELKVTGRMLRLCVSRAEFRTGCISSFGLISSTVFEALEPGSLGTKVSFSELPLCVSSCLGTLSKLGTIFHRSTCLTLTQLLGLSLFSFVCELPALCVKESTIWTCCLCWAFASVICTEGTFSPRVVWYLQYHSCETWHVDSTLSLKHFISCYFLLCFGGLKWIDCFNLFS